MYVSVWTVSKLYNQKSKYIDKLVVLSDINRIATLILDLNIFHVKVFRIQIRQGNHKSQNILSSNLAILK